MKMNKIYFLDVGSIRPIRVKTIEIQKDGILCEYLDSVPSRQQVIPWDILEYNGYRRGDI